MEASKDITHGIRYSLTLHDRYGTTVLGYDNAHAMKLPKKVQICRTPLALHHRHRTSSDQGIRYLFESPQRLLEDFFAEVDRVIRESGK